MSLVEAFASRAKIFDCQKNGSLQSLDWTGGLDWWTGLKIIFMLANENSPVELHLETQPLLHRL